MEPQEYDVILYGAGDRRIGSVKTWGAWSIEGDYLITWTKEGLKEATAIKTEVVETIRTEKVEKKSASDNDGPLPRWAKGLAAKPTVRGVSPDYVDSAE